MFDPDDEMAEIRAMPSCLRCDGRGWIGGVAPGQHGWLGAPPCPDCGGFHPTDGREIQVRDRRGGTRQLGMYDG